jgi:GT2 family glycosyltransferase
MSEGAARPELSVVLSTLGMYDVLRRVLDGYSRQDAPSGAFELIVVTDQADPDPDAVDAAIGERTYPVRRITGHAPGLSANRNSGRRAARAPLVMFTDNDTIPTPSLVSEHLAWHHRHPETEVAVLGHVRWAPELEVTTFMRWLDHGIQFDYPNIHGIEAGWGRFYGANSSLKRSFIERVGDFDEERLPYGYEDLEWAYRASKLGFRLLYNRRAVVDHLRPMTLEFWKKRVRRAAVAERQFVTIHPELRPWYHGMFTHALRQPPARGRGIGLARYVPRRAPWLGKRIWSSVDLAYKQALAPHFLEAWEEAGRGETGPVAPDLSERAAEPELRD